MWACFNCLWGHLVPFGHHKIAFTEKKYSFILRNYDPESSLLAPELGLGVGVSIAVCVCECWMGWDGGGAARLEMLT